MTTDISPGCKAIAQRMVHAHDSFVSEVQEQFGATKVEAEKVLRAFRDAKAVKLDVSMGRYALTHGAFWEAEVIQRAIES